MKRPTAKLVEAIHRPGKYHDGDAGLYLYVQERNGRLRKSCLQRVTVNGKRVESGLGSTKWTTPSEARAAAQANRKIARPPSDGPRGGLTRRGDDIQPADPDRVPRNVALSPRMPWPLSLPE